MKRDYGDMYQYILESKKAVRNIISNHEEIFHDAIEYFFNGNYEQIYVIGSGTSYHAALAAKNLMEKVLQMKVFASYPIVFKDERIFNKNTLVMDFHMRECRHQQLRGWIKQRQMVLEQLR